MKTPPLEDLAKVRRLNRPLHLWQVAVREMLWRDELEAVYFIWFIARVTP